MHGFDVVASVLLGKCVLMGRGARAVCDISKLHYPPWDANESVLGLLEPNPANIYVLPNPTRPMFFFFKYTDLTHDSYNRVGFDSVICY